MSNIIYCFKSMNVEGRVMNDRYELILKEVSLQYPDVNFGIMEEHKGIHLVYDNMELLHNEDFFDFACDVAYKYLEGGELNVFAILYDYDSELVTSDIISKIKDAGRYNYTENFTSKMSNADFTQPLTSIPEGAYAA